MYDKLYGMMNWPLIEGIEYTDIDNPSDLLGQHIIEDGLLVQAFIPDAAKVSIKYDGKKSEMYKMDEEGFYATIIDSDKTIQYKYEIEKDGNTYEMYDAYSFYMQDLIYEYRKFNAGIAYSAHEFMGAHHQTISGVDGVRFCVWAPNALRVSVVGDFNNWDGRIHQMSRIEDTGIFEIFIPEVQAGAMYKFEIKKKGGENLLKSDPYSFKVESFPGNASLVPEKDEFKWSDVEWFKKRDSFVAENSPISIYQFDVTDFMTTEGATYKTIAKDVVDYVSKMGYTHVELLPFATTYREDSEDYIPEFIYAPDTKYGTASDLKFLINSLHAKGIGVIVDWTPTSFGESENGLSYFDGSCLYESQNPKRAINPSTGAHMFNYGKTEVTNYLLANAFMLVDEFHFDGISIVNIAEMLYHDYNRKSGQWEPNIYGGSQNLEAIEFIKHFNSILHKTRKGILTLADDNSGMPNMTGVVGEDCLGFDLKLNHEWKKDFLEYMSVPAYLRESHYNDLSLSMVYQYSDNFVVGFDAKEFTDGKSSMISRMAGDTEESKFANMKLALAYEFVHPGKKILFAGQDMATYEEWSKTAPLDMDVLKEDKHKDINALVKALNKIYKDEKALFELDDEVEGFEWINNISARESVLTFVRKGKSEDDLLLVACNFDAVDREDYKIGVPVRGKYKEIFNTDSKTFGGTGFTNPRLKQSKTDECDGREESVRVNLAGLSISIYKFSKADEKATTNSAAKANAKTKAAEKKATEKKATKTAEKKTTKKAASAKTTKTTKSKTTVKAEEKAVKAEKKDAEVKVTEQVADQKETTAKATEKKETTSKAADKKETAAKATDKKETVAKATEKKETASKKITKK